MFVVRLELKNINDVRLITEALVKYVKDVKKATGNDIDKYFPGADLTGLYGQLGLAAQLLMKEEEKENEER